MKCDACGAPVENGKCTYCGKVFVAAEADYAEKTASAQPVVQVESQNPKMKKKNLVTCKSCGGDVAKGVKKCPHCGAKIKKPVYKKIWFWILVIALISAIAGGGSSKDEKTSSSSSPSASTSVEQQVKDSQKQVEEVVDTFKEQTEQLLDEAKEATSATKEEPVKEEPNKTEESVNQESAKEETSGIRQELKDFLTSYEAVMDEYVEFMKSYNASDLSMMTKYLDILNKYTDFADKAEAWSGKDLNSEELTYYMEVMNRVNSKLLTVTAAQ